ncbi:hypothetical protein QVD17_23494 [Tagetes erecta]|uniref:C2 domain-containing protein n=1 Tax=Tagetes erecta TaxID=13708 RepID=A0AAD8KEJ8_TARER|nr:hypothetical protein QVD17_23494 [Tagetes erecta]
MTIGTLEVNLVDARGLPNTDFFKHKIDPYALIQCSSQQLKSKIAKRQGSNPKWNEKFKFRVEYPGVDKHPKLVFKIMDHDTFTADDYLGEATIYLKEVLEQGIENGIAELHAQKYSVVGKHQKYCGDVQVALTFIPEVETDVYGQGFGGWKESQGQ